MTNSVFVNTQGLYQRRRAYNMSYRNDFTCNIGEMIPVYLQDLMPNVSWSARVHGLIRFQPLMAPIMDNVDFYLHFWLAPRRTLEGEEFTKMITGEYEVEDWPGVFWTPEHVLSEVNSLYPAQAVKEYILGPGSIFDMLGYDSSLWFGENSSEGKLNARKFCLYFQLLSNWYTNENVEPYNGFFDEVDVFNTKDFIHDYNDGDISTLIADIVCHFYAEYGTAGFAPHLWPKDYFTSALPTLQYGLPTYLPLGESAPVVLNSGSTTGITIGPVSPSVGLGVISKDGYQFVGGEYASLEAHVALDSTGAEVYATQKPVDSEESDNYPISGISGTLRTPLAGVADLSEATAITINELRVANALQVFKEREMRFGRRAPEYYKGFYGVTPGDLRLQLPKFLGGGRLPVNISDIEQTSASQEGSPQGKLAGKGTALGAGFAKAHAFTAEEAFIMGIGWLMPKITYANQLSRFDTKLNDRFMYYNPSFAHIGEQEVYNYEIFAGSYGTNEGSKEFGYQPRYTEYRFHANEMHGEFKTSLAFWTLGRIFEDQPALNRQFVYMQPKAMQRIFAAQFDSNGHMIRNVLASLKFSVAMLQPLSRYGTPGLLA